MEKLIENIISEMCKKYDDLCIKGFEKCGYNKDYVLENPTAFHRYHSDFVTGYRDTYYLGNPEKGNALALFEIEHIVDFEKNKIYMQCNMLNNINGSQCD